MHYIRYRLQPYSGIKSRYRCPGCKHRTKTFTRYINPDTGQELAPHVGLCDRVLNCGYHFTPRQYFAAEGTAPVRQPSWKPLIKPKQPTSYIPVDVVNESLDNYQHNNFILYLVDKLGIDTADLLLKRYCIGTSTRWPGATVFWQIDIAGKVRTGKIMLYNRQTGKRVKKPYNHVTWMHTQAGKSNYNLEQCLFGEHQLTNNDEMPVAIVESEKTAIIASAFMPGFIWLASGGLDGLNIGRCKVLQNRKVVLFPDANGYNKWQQRAADLSKAMPGTLFKTSDCLEKDATTTDREAGIDLGDILLK